MKRDNSYFSIVFAVLIIVASWAYCYVSGFGGYKSKAADIDRISDEVKMAQDKYNSLVQTKAAIANNKDLVTNTLVAVAQGSDTENTIAEIEALASAQKLVIPSIQISGETASADATASSDAVTLGFTVNGSFEAINALVKSIEKDVKFMTIDNITMSSTDTGMSATIGLKTYTR
ncbi:MAG: GspMb/PilO family protein [Candidatus Berkelbacteria bacterium]